MSPVAAANPPSPALSSGVAAPADLVSKTVGHPAGHTAGHTVGQVTEWSVRGSEGETAPTATRVKQMHPADLALLTNAARSIRLRGR